MFSWCFLLYTIESRDGTMRGCSLHRSSLLSNGLVLSFSSCCFIYIDTRICGLALLFPLYLLFRQMCVYNVSSSTYLYRTIPRVSSAQSNLSLQGFFSTSLLVVLWFQWQWRSPEIQKNLPFHSLFAVTDSKHGFWEKAILHFARNLDTTSIGYSCLMYVWSLS